MRLSERNVSIARCTYQRPKSPLKIHFRGVHIDLYQPFKVDISVFFSRFALTIVE